MKIVLLTRSLEFGGAQRQLIALARGLQSRGHHVVVAVFYENGPMEADLHEAGVPVHVLNKSGRWDMVPFTFRLLRFLRGERPDILHTYLGGADFASALANLVLPSSIVWGIRATEMRQESIDWLGRVLDPLHRTLGCWIPDLVISNSHAGRAYAVSRGMKAERVIVIPNGVDTDRFRPDSVARARVRKELGVNQGESLIGLVGRLDAMKGHRMFLQAAALLNESQPEARYICVGTGAQHYELELRQLGSTLGLDQQLIWAGPRDDMPAVYNALDIMVLPSAYGEGFPNVVGEAMATGIPCIVTDVGDSAFVVGDVGEVIDNGDPGGLQEAIRRTMDKIEAGQIDPQKMRLRVVEEFSLSAMVERTAQALQDLLHRRVA